MTTSFYCRDGLHAPNDSSYPIGCLIPFCDCLCHEKQPSPVEEERYLREQSLENPVPWPPGPTAEEERMSSERARELRAFCLDELMRDHKRRIASLEAVSALPAEAAERIYYLFAQEWRNSPDYKVDWDLKPYHEAKGADRRQYRDLP